ncbi:hypothetical protein BKA70DRAFT_1261908 [Coprinopsis sp. MPI-PUGE-AT-0042]|nr:hypothetical protein BKA70DRAFT_1261908 [Coprinopsis sp. MPI-PUGE-AT-0042]
MAIVKAPKTIKISVPRHNAHPIGAKLDAEIKRQAKAKRTNVDTSQPTSELIQAIESASEWNSMLTTARAERGPQWDIGTQQFLVEEGSDLQFDATELFQAAQKARDAELGPQTSQRLHPPPPPPQQQLPPQFHHGNRNHATPMRDRGPGDFSGGHMGGGPGMDHTPHGHRAPPPGPGGNFGVGAFQGSPGAMRGPVSGGAPFSPAGGPQFNNMGPHHHQSPGQGAFYAGNALQTPMRMGTMGGMSMEDQGLGGMGGMGMGGGMGGMPGGSPAPRRMTRTMTEEF